MSSLLLRNATVYPDPWSIPLCSTSIHIEGGVIVSVRPSNLDEDRTFEDCELIDCEGKIVTAGYWDSHVHLMTPVLRRAFHSNPETLSAELFRLFTRHGFTTVFDLASRLSNTVYLRALIEKGSVIGPNILTTGEAFYPQNGTPAYVSGLVDSGYISDWEVPHIAGASQRVDSQISSGADAVKIFTASITRNGIVSMGLSLASVLVAASHANGKLVFAHSSSREGIEIALTSGIDVLAHAVPLSGTWREGLGGRLVAQGVSLIPTLGLFRVQAHVDGDSRQKTAAIMFGALEQLKEFRRCGGSVLFGTDIGYLNGITAAEEIKWMHKGGMSPRDILHSLTTAPSERFGYRHCYGRVDRGMIADLAVLSADPIEDLSAFTKVTYVVKGGTLISL